jgi:hypothetical protein
LAADISRFYLQLVLIHRCLRKETAVAQKPYVHIGRLETARCTTLGQCRYCSGWQYPKAFHLDQRVHSQWIWLFWSLSIGKLPV